MIRQQLQSTLTIFLRKAAHAAARAAADKARKVFKLDQQDEVLAILQAANDAIDWDSIVDDMANDIEAAAIQGGQDGIAQLAISASLVPDMTQKIEDAAREYADKRAAE